MRSVCFILLSALLFSLSACEPSHQQQKQASAAKDEEKDIIPLSAEKRTERKDGLITAQFYIPRLIRRKQSFLRTASLPAKRKSSIKRMVKSLMFKSIRGSR